MTGQRDDAPRHVHNAGHGQQGAAEGSPASQPASPLDETESSGRREATGAVEHELALMLRHSRRIAGYLATHVHPELDAASYAILIAVDNAHLLRSTDLAERVGLDKSTVSRQIAHLTELDMLQQAPDPHDGRARHIQLTESARGKLREVRQHRREHLYRRFSDWSTHDLREMARVLAKLNNQFR